MLDRGGYPTTSPPFSPPPHSLHLETTATVWEPRAAWVSGISPRTTPGAPRTATAPVPPVGIPELALAILVLGAGIVIDQDLFLVAAKEQLRVLVVALDDDLGGLLFLVQDVGHVVAGHEPAGGATIEGGVGVESAKGVVAGEHGDKWSNGTVGAAAGEDEQLGGIVDIGILGVGSLEGVGRGQDGGQGEKGGLEVHGFGERERGG